MVCLSMSGIDGKQKRKDLRMERIKQNGFNYYRINPLGNKRNSGTVIFYHGWGMAAESYKELASEIAAEGYSVVIPEIVYHDTRAPLENWFNEEVIQTYFWKTIIESIEEFEVFFQQLQISRGQTYLVGSSMGGFIANGIFAAQENIGGLVNINGSGSFLLSENLFRKRDKRRDLTLEEEKWIKGWDPIERQNFPGPVLLMHGDMDSTISIVGQESYFQHLIANGKREHVKFSIYPGVNHNFTEEMVKALIDWLNHVKRGGESEDLE